MELTFTDSYRKLLEQISDTYRNDDLERKFYEKQAIAERWSVPELKRVFELWGKHAQAVGM